MSVKTRIAPSPTGYLHIGGLRTALYNYAFAKNKKGKFILRIEDTDRSRLVEGSFESLIDVLKELGLNWDEGPKDENDTNSEYIQSNRLGIYRKYVQKLIESGNAYYCFCSKERLDELKSEQKKKGSRLGYDKKCLHLPVSEVEERVKNEEFVVRLNVKPGETISFSDLVYGKIEFDSSNIDDQVLIKSDGFPTYHFAVVVDDHLMGVTHILRGNEWLPSTPKHILLYKYFGWEVPYYCHLPNLKEKGQNKKLSKRYGSVFVTQFLEDGYLPEALLNHLMFLGWNPGTEKEIYSLEEFINDFSLDKIHKTDLVVFDREKLLWFNGYYIRNLDIEELYDCILHWAKKYNKKIKFTKENKKYSIRVLSLIRERLKKFSEIEMLVSYFYNAPAPNSEDLVKYTKDKFLSVKILNLCNEVLENIENFNSHTIDLALHEMLNVNNIKPKETFMTLRIAVTGREVSPPIFEVIEVLGKDEVLRRITNSINYLS